jgi:hypothetical protein
MAEHEVIHAVPVPGRASALRQGYKSLHHVPVTTAFFTCVYAMQNIIASPSASTRTKKTWSHCQRSAANCAVRGRTIPEAPPGGLVPVSIRPRAPHCGLPGMNRCSALFWWYRCKVTLKSFLMRSKSFRYRCASHRLS